VAAVVQPQNVQHGSVLIRVLYYCYFGEAITAASVVVWLI